MKFRNYCIVVMGYTEEILPEIIKISDTTPNMLDAKGIVIATFSSVAEPSELTDYFKSNGRNILVFDLNSKYSGFHLGNDDISKGLFGFLEYMNEDALRQKTDELIQEITSTTVTNVTHKQVENKVMVEAKITLEEINKMTKDEKNDLMNELIDKGGENLSEYEKKIMNKLAK